MADCLKAITCPRSNDKTVKHLVIVNRMGTSYTLIQKAHRILKDPYRVLRLARGRARMIIVAGLSLAFLVCYAVVHCGLLCQQVGLLSDTLENEIIATLIPGETSNFMIMKPAWEPEVKPDIFTLVLIISAPGNKRQRNAIRRTWGRAENWDCLRLYTNHEEYSYQSVFMVGSTTDAVDNFVMDEAETYNDLLLGNFNDTYSNLLFKSLMGLSWASNVVNCSYVIKTDDDVYLNMPKILQWLQTRNKTARLYAGKVASGWSPIRDPSNKNFIPHTDYAKKTLPDFCPGTFYVLSRNILQFLLGVARFIKPLQTEDVYIGMLVQAIGLDPVKVPLVKNYVDANEKALDVSLCRLHTYSAITHNLTPATIRKVHFRMMVSYAMSRSKSQRLCRRHR